MDPQLLPKTDISRFNNDWFDEGASKFKWFLWFMANGLFVNTPLNPFNALRIFVLRAFGAKIGKGVILKHRVNVKFPWNLTIGDYCWIGEAVWIENQGKVTIGNNCCLSQGVVMMTGNHNYKKVTFDLIVKPITLEDGVWLGASAIVTQGVTCYSHAVLGVGAVANRDLEAYTIYAGNPCQPHPETRDGSRMKVSIITVVYNGAATIASAVDSVVAQDHPDIEYIVIDGGSKDRTVEILQSYGSKIAVLVSERDKGIYDAMNKGLARATGDVIGILNADDFYTSPDVISAVVAELQRAGTDSLIGDLIFVKPENLDHVVRFYSSEGFSLRKFEHGDMPPHPTFFVRREVYERLGNFDTQYRITSDFDLMLRFLYTARISWTYLPKVMVTMRTGGLTNQGFKSKVKLNREIIASMRNNGLPAGTFRVYSKYLTKIFQLLKRPKSSALPRKS